MKIYKCDLCGNVMLVLSDSGVNPVCCNEDMKLLTPQVNEDLFEKHLPNVKREGDKVIVEVNHVSEDKHYIEFIILKTNKNTYIKYLGPNIKPCASFIIGDDEKIMEAYEYCNIHGLFMKECKNEKAKGC